MDAACIAWDTAFLLPVLLSLSSSFPLFQPAPPLSPLLPMAQVCVCSSRWLSCFSCLRCCGFALLPVVLGGACSFACQGWVLVCFLPRLPPFLSLFGLLVVCSLCLFSAFVVLSFVSPLFVVAGCPCSLPSFPLPPLVCVCQHWQTFSQQIYSDYTDQWTSDKVLKVKRKFQHFVISCFASSVDDSVLWQSHLLDEVHPDWQMFLYKNTESFEQFLH